MKIIDTENYSKLNKTEKLIFDGWLETVLQIFPSINDDGKSFEDLTISFAERFAFKATEKITPIIEGIVNEKIEEKIVEVDKIIKEIQNQITTSNGKPTI